MFTTPITKSFAGTVLAAGTLGRAAAHDNPSRNLAARVALVLSGLAITLGICIGSAGHASAATSCAELQLESMSHEGRKDRVDRTDFAAVQAYNSEATMLDGEYLRLHCTYPIH